MRQWILAWLFAFMAVVPAGAGVLVVASMDESRVAIVDARTFETLATVATGKSPHEFSVAGPGRWRSARYSARRAVIGSSLRARRAGR